MEINECKPDATTEHSSRKQYARYLVALERQAAAAEQQAAELRMVREVLETLLDTMAAEVQP